MERVCCVVDFDGFQLKGRKFLVREAAFVSVERPDLWGLLSFDLSEVELRKDDFSSVWFCRNKIHGIPFHPRKSERPVHLDRLDGFLYEMYNRCSTATKDLVGYKGGICERDRLQELGIPCVNLEKYDCPKFETLLGWWGEDMPPEDVEPCHLHDKSKEQRTFHCALTEVKFFREYVKNYVGRRKMAAARRGA